MQVGPDGDVYLTDSGNSRIRRIDREGIIHNVIGQGPLVGLFAAGFTAEYGPIDEAQIFTPTGIAFDSLGNLYFSESSNRIRLVTRSLVVTIAGNGEGGASGDGGKATAARINTPGKLAVDRKGNVYFADQPNNRIRRIDTQGIITTVAGSGEATGFIYESEEQ